MRYLISLAIALMVAVGGDALAAEVQSQGNVPSLQELQQLHELREERRDVLGVSQVRLAGGLSEPR